MSLFLPRLPSDLSRRRWRVEASRPILLSRVEHQREVVAACCALSEQAGVRAGMTVSQARALLAGGVHHESLDAALLTRALRRLALRAQRFSPRVGVCEPDGLWLDVSGCSHLFGGVEVMTRRVARWFTRSGLECRVAVAPCMGAAWALARYGQPDRMVYRAKDLHGALGPLPVGALRLEPARIEAMAQVGLCTIGAVLQVPRHELAGRYGAEVARRLDQALGRMPESFEPVRERRRLVVGRMFAGPTDRPGAIALCVRQLVEAVSARLEKREAGYRQLVLTLLRSDLEPVELVATAGRPTRDAGHWYTLLRPQLERAHLGFGVEGVTLAALGVSRLRHEQATRWIDSPRGGGAGDAEAARLVDTLCSRLGRDGVLRVMPRASHIPERSFTLARAQDAERQKPSPPTAPPPPLDRPTILLGEPEPIGVVYLRPDGPIGRVRIGGRDLGVIVCMGPERIGGEWWAGEECTREYYRLHTDDGAWLWVFCQAERGRWFLHGEWA